MDDDIASSQGIPEMSTADTTDLMQTAESTPPSVNVSVNIRIVDGMPIVSELALNNT